MRVFVLVVAVRFCAPAASAAPTSTFKSLSPGDWMTYEVPAVDKEDLPCCFEGWRGSAVRRPCRLDGGGSWRGTGAGRPGTLDSQTLRIFVRRAQTGYDRVLAVGAGCEVDAAGQQVTELSNVSGSASVAFLERHLAKASRGRRAREGLAALAHHRTKAATKALTRLSASGRALRKDAFFWLAHLRGAAGLEVVRRALAREPTGKLRRHLVFCLSQNDGPEMPEELRQIARRHDDEDVRGEALFWLAQREDPAVEAIATAQIDAGEASRQRKRAVFALSQLPPERAIPALKAIARSERPRWIRKEALFWLAQQDDDRVLAEFDAIFSGAAP